MEKARPHYFRTIPLLLVLAAVIVVYTQRHALVTQLQNTAAERLSSFLGEQVSFDALEMDIFDLSLSVLGVRVGTMDLSGENPLITVDRIFIQLDSGSTPDHVRIATAIFEKPVVRVPLDDGQLLGFSGLRALIEGNGAKQTTGGEAADGARVDIDMLQVVNGELLVTDGSTHMELGLRGLQAEMSLVDLQPDRLEVDIGTLDFRQQALEDQLEALHLMVDFRKVPAQVSELSLEFQGGSLSATGDLWMDDHQGPPGVRLDVSARVDLSTINRLVPGVPSLSGLALTEATLTYRDGFQAHGKTHFTDLVVDFITIGQGMVEFEADPDQIDAKHIEVDLEQGQVHAQAVLSLHDRMSIQAQADLDDVQLAELLERFDLLDPWVMMGVSGKVSAEGFLFEPFGLKGAADLRMREFQVHSRSFRRANRDNPILTLHSAHIVGDLAADAQGVDFRKTLLTTDRSQLYLDGRIGLNGTLDLEFDAVKLDLSELSPLAGFELSGSGWGKGEGHGPFSQMVFSADVSLFEAHFDDYLIGDLDGWFWAALDPTPFLSEYQRILSAGEGGTSEQPEGAKSAAMPQSVRGAGAKAPPPLKMGRGRFWERPLDGVGFAQLLPALERLNHRYYDGNIWIRSPPLLLLPIVSTKVKKTRVSGIAAIVFDDPVTVYADLSLPEKSPEATTSSHLMDLIAMAEVELEGHPVNGQVSGNIEVMGPPAHLDGQGHLDLWNAAIYGQLIDTARADIRVVGGDLQIDRLDAEVGTGRFKSDGWIGQEGGLSATLQLESMPFAEIDPLAGSGMGGLAQGLVTIRGSFERPHILGQVRLEQVTLDAKPLGETVLTLSTANGAVRIGGQALDGRAKIDATVELRTGLPYSLDVVLESFPIGPYLAINGSEGLSVEMRLGGHARAEGELSGEAPLALDLNLNELFASKGTLEIGNEGPVLLSLREGRFRVDRAELIGPGTRLSLKGGLTGDERVDFDVSGQVNLALLRVLAPEIFHRAEGTLALSDRSEDGVADGPFHLGGTLSALELEGAGQITRAAIKTDYFTPTIDQISALILIGNNNEIQLQRINGSLGGGVIDGGGVMVLGPDYYPRHYDLFLNGRDAFIRYPDFLPPGLMDASLRFNGEVGNLLLSGDVDLRRMVYRERYHWEKILTDFRTYRLESVESPLEEEPYFDMDLRIHAPGTFFIRNNLGNIQLTGELQVMGDTSGVELRGEVASERGTVTMLDNTFNLTAGQLEFLGDYWNPTIDLRLETEIDSYTIYYQLVGTLQDWRLIPGSDAGLSERDINSLIAFGTLADNITEGEARALAAPTLEFLVGRFGAGLLEPLQAFTRLDRFTVVPVPDLNGNLSVRLYGEKEIKEGTLWATGYYDYGLSGTQEFLADLEWRLLECCSTILRLESKPLEYSSPLNPGLRLKLKLEFD